jgi:agmatine deiminase
LPAEASAKEGKRLPGSYANFYIGNGVVIVPLFAVPEDGEALKVLQSVFPNHKAIGINAQYLVYGFGTFHCMSQQQPVV